MIKQNTQYDSKSFKILALIVGAALICAVSMSTTAHAEDVKKIKDSKKEIKKDSKNKKIKDKIVKMGKKEAKIVSKVTNTTKIVEIKSEVQPKIDPMQKKLDACKVKETQREQYECEKALQTGNSSEEFKSKATAHVIGPITFYYAGATVEKSNGQDIVNLKFLVENTGSKDNVALYCTGPAVCNYDVSDGTTTYKYASQDFTNGQIVLKPGSSRIFNMLFGPAIGYGSYVEFKFDPSKQYTFNVKEPWGSGTIPLNLK